MGARRAGAPAFVLAPRGLPGHLRRGYLLAQPEPAAARRPPLPSPRRAPPPAPPARPGPPDAGLAPPQPCGPEGAGPPGAWPTPPNANPPSHWPLPAVRRFLSPRLGLPRQPPTRPSPPPAPTCLAPGPRPLLRAPPLNPRSTHFPLPLARGSSNHWSVVPVHFLREFSTSWQEEAAAPLDGRPRGDGWVLEGKAEPPFGPKRLGEAAPFVCSGSAGARWAAPVLLIPR